MKLKSIVGQLRRVLAPLWGSTRDLLPIVVVIGLFQAFVFRQPLENAGQVLIGMGLVIVGLTLFLFGLEAGLFPVGEQMAFDFARKGSLVWLIAFAFTLGFGTTFAEPALIAVAGKAAELAATDIASAHRESTSGDYAMTLRLTVAISVGMALVIGVVRIALGIPIHYLIITGYTLVMVLTPFAPPSMIAVAYDSGGVTTSTITVPLTAALGVGLASSLKGRDPLIDGFGLIALASVMPIILVLILGICW